MDAEWTKDDELLYVKRIGQHGPSRYKTSYDRKKEIAKLLTNYLQVFDCRIWDLTQAELMEIKKFATEKLQRCVDYLNAHVPEDYPDYPDPEEA